MSGDELRLLTLHGMRLAGLASADDVAALHDLDAVAVGEELDRLQADGLVAAARGGDGRWTLTADGRRHGEMLLARELDAATGAGETGRQVVVDAYEQFVDLNQPMLELCTRWQLLSLDPVVLNDHSDPAHDAAVMADLGELDDRVRPICARLESVLTRFGRYRPGFSEALRRLRSGETEWLTKPTILSYHTLWFQLHEDLLATLGLERAAETVRLNGEPTTEPPRANPDPTETTR